MVSTAIQKHPIVITQQPKMFIGTIGQVTHFHVEAEGKGLTYQWQYSTGGPWSTTGLPGYLTPTLEVTVTNARYSYFYRCLITDEDGYSITSDVVRLLRP